MIISLVSLALLSAPAAAPAPVAAGTRVRVKAELATGQKIRWSGTLVSADAERLELLSDVGRVPVTVRLSDVRSLEVSRGRESKGKAALRAGSKAFLVSAGVATVVFGLAASKRVDDTEAAVGLAGAGMLGVVAATTAGALIGATHPSERWTPVEGVHARLLVEPRRRGLAAALALRF